MRIATDCTLPICVPIRIIEQVDTRQRRTRKDNAVENSEIIKFQPNIPVRLTLKYGDTKPCKSRFSAEDQYMLSATDGRIAFLTPYCNSKLQAAGVQRG